MILNKKGFMMLPLAALLFATGCAKQISFDEAQKFVDDNYSKSEPKTPTKLTTNFSANVPDDSTRAYVKSMIEASLGGITLTEEGTNLKYSGDIDTKGMEPIPAITKDYLVEPTDDIKVTYSLKGKSLSLDFSAGLENEQYDIEEAMMHIDIKKADINGSASTNDQGLPTYAKVKLDVDATITIKTPVSGFTFNEDPALNLKLTGELSVNATY